MKCAICKTGETKQGFTNVVLQRGEATIIVKHVPADICAVCGEYYLSEKEAGSVLRAAEDAVGKGSELQVLRYAA